MAPLIQPRKQCLRGIVMERITILVSIDAEPIGFFSRSALPCSLFFLLLPLRQDTTSISPSTTTSPLKFFSYPTTKPNPNLCQIKTPPHQQLRHPTRKRSQLRRLPLPPRNLC